MPLYVCNTKPGVLNQAAKAQIAKAITDIHCDVTGAPACFVHAFFFEEAQQFPLGEHQLQVRGTIRKGRSNDQKDEIAKRIQQALVTEAKVADHQAAALILETPASWVLEGGEIMPEPGEETAWFEAQAARRAEEA